MNDDEKARYDLSHDPREVADALGLSVVVPGDSDLFVDLDDEADEAVLDRVLAVFRRNNFPIEVVKTTISKSGNKHVYLRVPAPYTVTSMERVALQAILGSDRVREALSFLRWLNGIDRPATVFFEVPDPVLEWVDA